jgi:DNA-binding PadR family transcriptional regulator
LKLEKKSRTGKYHEYGKRVLQLLIEQKYDVSTTFIKNRLKIPRSSLYDVLGKLRDYGYIDWIGEFQDQISMILITEKGKNHLEHLVN